ncbi:MAG: hypothetical protein CMP21_03750 [Rickettsiales bacterium]|nr:hypothetical protein [Rickettsiales bacterium]|tara:strand:- start:10551 stop:14591 length:4041 start_codon:yes stop_codon:yes gene_type:complete
MEYQNNKISELIESQLPNFLQEDGPKFVKFVEKYYEFMETSKLEVSSTEELNLIFSSNTPSVKIRASQQIDGSEHTKHVYAEVLNSYLLENGNYVFYIKENNEQIQVLSVSDSDVHPSLNPNVGIFNIGDIVSQEQPDNKIVKGKVLHLSNKTVTVKETVDGQEVDVDYTFIDKVVVLNNFTPEKEYFGIFDVTNTGNDTFNLGNGSSSTPIFDVNSQDSTSTRGFLSGDSVEILTGDNGYTGQLEVIDYIQNATLSSKNLWNLQDIDRTLDDYVDFFMKEYLEGFPLTFPNEFQSTDIDVAEFKKFLVKHSREFYQSKGTEDSFKYFFRTIFNEDVKVSYPKDNVLKPSDNTFSKSKTILIKPSDVTIVPEIASQKIVGQSSGVSAYVETISSTKRGGYFVYEIALNEYGISGDFFEDEDVYLESDPSTIIGTIYYGVSSVSINDVEESFTVGDIFYIDRSGEVIDYTDIQNIDRGALIELDVCSVNSGKITDIEVVNGGIGYSVGDKLVFDNTKCLSPTGPIRPIEAVVSEITEFGYSINNPNFDNNIDDWQEEIAGQYGETEWSNSFGGTLKLISFPPFYSGVSQPINYDFSDLEGFKLKLRVNVKSYTGERYLRIGVYDDSTSSWVGVQSFLVDGVGEYEVEFEPSQSNNFLINSSIKISWGGQPPIEDLSYKSIYIDDVRIVAPNGIAIENGVGLISKINVRCDGKGYIKYPTLTQIGDHNITSESFNLIGNDVGTLKQVKIRKTGIGYKRSKVEHYLEDWEGTQSSLVLDKTQIGIELPYLNLKITTPSGDFTVGEIVNHQTLDGTGKVVSWDSGTGILVLREYSGVFISDGDDIIEGDGSSETGTVGTASYNKTKFKIGNGGTDVWADLNYSVASWYDSILNQPYNISLDLNSSGTDDIELNFGSIFDDGGRFLNNNSFISDVKYIQDSFYYQVYSYLLESSVEVRKYRDLLKRLIHPAGMNMFGRISTETVKQVKMSFSQIKTNVSMVIWDYIGKHSNKLIRDFDFLYSLLILDGDDSSPYNLELQMSYTSGNFEVGQGVQNFSQTLSGISRISTIGGGSYDCLIGEQGSGTSYTTELKVGDLIKVKNNWPSSYTTIHKVTQVLSDSVVKFTPSTAYNINQTVDVTSTKAKAKVKSWDSDNQILTLEDIVGDFSISTWILQDFDETSWNPNIFSYTVSESTQDFIETEVDGSDSGVLIPQIYYHGSYACDYLYNENTHQNYRFKIKYKNLRPGTPKNNDFYDHKILTGTVSIPHDSNCDGTLQFFTLTGVGTDFQSELIVGDMISVLSTHADPDKNIYQLFKVVSINSNTELIVNIRHTDSNYTISNSEFLKRELIGD